MQKKTYPVRARFAEDIVAEVKLPPRQTGKIAILVSGLPARPVSERVLDFFSGQGYLAIAPRFRGTWESDGVFLRRSPADDIRDVIDALVSQKSITDLYLGERVPASVKRIHLFGASFGGPAVLLNAEHPKVEKVVALAPVLDWRVEGEDEPFRFFTHFTREAFGQAYRLANQNDWQKLLRPDFYSPIDMKLPTHAAKKIFIIHAADDRVVPIDPLIHFSEKTGVTVYRKPKGGHFGMRQFAQKFYWKKIQAFLRKR